MKKAVVNTNKGQAFEGLLREYERQAMERSKATEQDYTLALTNLAKAITYSVLNKCIDPSRKADQTRAEQGKAPTKPSGHNPVLVNIKRSIARDYDALARLNYATQNATATERNKNGDLVVKILDSDLNDAIAKLLQHTCGDGIDLVQDTIVAIMSETNKISNLEIGFMEQPYEVRRLKRKVRIKEDDSVDGWETVETNPIHEVYRAVRRCIENSRAKQNDTRNGYCYLQDLATDPESDAVDIIYKRYGKYADIGGYAVDSNGRETLYSADEQTVADIDLLISKLNLSTQQARIIKYRLRGYGYKAIATALGVKQRNITTQLQRIQEKAQAIGLAPIK